LDWQHAFVFHSFLSLQKERLLHCLPSCLQVMVSTSLWKRALSEHYVTMLSGRLRLQQPSSLTQRAPSDGSKVEVQKSKPTHYFNIFLFPRMAFCTERNAKARDMQLGVQ
jgi:hypothetical protein